MFYQNVLSFILMITDNVSSRSGLSWRIGFDGLLDRRRAATDRERVELGEPRVQCRKVGGSGVDEETFTEKLCPPGNISVIWPFVSHTLEIGFCKRTKSDTFNSGKHKSFLSLTGLTCLSGSFGPDYSVPGSFSPGQFGSGLFVPTQY